MRNVLTIARRELLGFFLSPVAYVVGALFLVLQGVTFFLFLDWLNRPNAPPGAVFSFYFGGTFLFWVSLILVVSVLPMRLIAEERRSGTLEPLLTAPVTEAEVVLGKYLGVLGFYVALWVPTLLYVPLVRAAAGPVDAGPIAAGYLGTLLEGAAFLAFGTLASTLTRSQIVAAVLSFVFTLVLLLVGVFEGSASAPWLRGALAHASLFKHMEELGRGIVDTRQIVFALSLTVFSLFAAIRALAASRGP